MSVHERYFLDIPIYRCPIDKHTKELEDKQNRFLDKMLEPKDSASESYKNAKLWWNESKWYPWKFNEIIGWLRLFVLTRQIRGQLWYSKTKRIYPRSNDIIYLMGNVFEHTFSQEQSDSEISLEVTAELIEFQKRKSMKGRFLDLECYSSIESSINWHKLLGFS
jgi:hypothetical protein